MEIKIRKAILKDAPGIAAMIKEGLKRRQWIYTGTNKYTKQKFENLKKSLIQKNTGTQQFIALNESNNKIIGSISYSYKKEGRQRHIAYFGWGVHPDYFGNGIGTKLLRYAIGNAKTRGIIRAEAEMAIKNTASWKMAKRCGFKIEGRKKKAMLTDNNKYIDTYIVGKIL